MPLLRIRLTGSEDNVRAISNLLQSLDGIEHVEEVADLMPRMDDADSSSAGLSDQATAELLYFRSNERGLVFERWRHVHGCGRFFNAARHSVTDKFITTYKAGQPKPEIDADGKLVAAAGFDANVEPGVMGDDAHTPVARTEAQQ